MRRTSEWTMWVGRGACNCQPGGGELWARWNLLSSFQCWPRAGHSSSAREGVCASAHRSLKSNKAQCPGALKHKGGSEVSAGHRGAVCKLGWSGT